jgi:prepilin signal peptidase PulO-like enzyme (type II secretory pathway)
MQALGGPHGIAPVFCAVVLWSALIFGLTKRAAQRIAPGTLPKPAFQWSVAIALAALAGVRGPHAALPVCVCIALLAAGIVDAHTGYLPDATTLPAAALGLAAALGPQRGSEACLGILESAGPFGFLHFISRGRATGLGDVKALYAIGAAFGPFGTAVVLFAASLSALALSLLRGRFSRTARIRFGPHLATGALLTLVFSEV